MTNDSPDPRGAAVDNSTGDDSSGALPRPGAADHSGATPRRRGLEGQVIADRYRVVRLVSAGANTLIADADDLELHRLVTLKLLRPEFTVSAEFRERFQQQMEAVAAMSHPNIAAVHDIGSATVGRRNTVYVASEYLSGGSLRDLFDRRRMLSPSQALTVGLDACRALDFAHRKGFVHTELTPSKLVFGDDRRLRIVDFGLARVLNEEIWTNPSELPTHVARYASPEQAQGLPVDGHTDVYSLALILHEAVTGEVPFAGDSTVSTLANRVDRLMPVSADLGPLASVLERSGRPEPSERWSAAQFGKALMRAAERMPRPEPIPILAPSPLNVDPSLLRRPNDPTGGIHRPDDPPQLALVPSAGAADETTSDAPAPDVSVLEAPALADADADADDRSRAASAATTDTATAAGVAADDVAGSAHADDAPATDDSGVPAPGAVAGADAARDVVDDAVGVDTAVRTASDASDAAARTGADGPAVVPAVGDEPVGAAMADLAELVERTPPKPPGAENVVDPSSRIDVVAPIPPKAAPARRKPGAGAAPVAARGAASGEPAPTGRVPVNELVGKTLTKKERKAAKRRAREREKWAKANAAKQPKSVRRSKGGAQPQAVYQQPTGRRWAPIVFTLAMLAALGGIGAIAWQLFRTESHEVPALAGLPLETGLAEVESFGWDVNPRTARSDDYPEPGQIIRTVPAALTELSTGSPLTIFYSVGPELRTVPPLAGQTVDEATAVLTELQLAQVVNPVYDETVPAGIVVGVDAEGHGPGAEVLPRTLVTLAVSQGPAPRPVPNLAGVTPDEAAALLAGVGFGVVTGEPVYHDSIPAGMVAAQTPAAGEGALPGSEVVVQLSQGVELVAVPDLRGVGLAQATQALGDAGLFVGSVVGNPDGSVVAATSGAAALDPGVMVRRGSLVNIVIL